MQLVLLNSSYSGAIARVAEFDQIAIVPEYAIWYNILWNSSYGGAVALVHTEIGTNRYFPQSAIDNTTCNTVETRN